MDLQVRVPLKGCRALGYRIDQVGFAFPNSVVHGDYKGRWASYARFSRHSFENHLSGFGVPSVGFRLSTPPLSVTVG